MLPLEHSAILLTFINRLSVLKTNFGVLSEWLVKTGFSQVWYLIVSIPDLCCLTYFTVNHSFSILCITSMHLHIQSESSEYQILKSLVNYLTMDEQKQNLLG